MFCYGACVCVLASKTSEQVLLPPSQRCLDRGRWGRKNSWSWESETFFNGKICLFKMYGDLFFNLWMSIFSHVLIVTSGALPVPYGLTVRNGCLVIAASAVHSFASFLHLFFYILFPSWWRWFLHFFANPQNFSAWENDGFNLTGDLKSCSSLFSFLSQFCLYN